MNSFKRLQEKMIEVEKECEHNGYYYIDPPIKPCHNQAAYFVKGA